MNPDDLACTVDLIIPYQGQLIWGVRGNEPFKDYLALPGGFLDPGRETLEEAACRELFEELGLKANPEDLKLIGVYSDPNRDPRGHIVSHAYEVTKFTGTPKANDDLKDFHILGGKPPKTAFDHGRIYDDWIRMRRNNYER